MKHHARMTVHSKNFILYLLMILMVTTGILSGESRARSAFLPVAEGAQGAVYRMIQSEPLTDEACTEKMIGMQTKLPVIRAFRPLRRNFRALLTEIIICTVIQAVHFKEFLCQNAFQGQQCAQGLVTTIHYIHDLDGKKSA